MQTGRIEAVIFDKDGTLVDLTTWDAITGQLIDRLVSDRKNHRAAADALEYDLDRRRFRPMSPVLAESNDVWIAKLAPFADDGTSGGFQALVERLTADWILGGAVPVTGAGDLVTELRRSGLRLALCTNDAEESARQQIEQLGWAQHFDAVVGYDSGHGVKPQPGMVLGALAELDVAADRAVMIGDSAADLLAARAAGVRSCLVDPNGRRDLGDLADHVVADLGEITPWIESGPLTR